MVAHGTIAFDTLTTSDQVNTGTEKSLDTSYIFNGVAKAWSNVNGTGTAAINDSFNVSGITDNGTGDTTNTYSNAMSNTTYVMTVSGGYVNDDGMARYSEATSNWRTYYYQESDRNAKDGSVNSSAIFGDLA
jgi:hypothetical protein